MPVAPDVPAIAETVPGYSALLWYGVIAPANTPQPIVDRLNQALSKAVQSPEIRDKLAADFGIDATHSSPQEFSKFIRSDIEKWTRVVKTGNIKLD
jgi:tripartite-type tricarboxylate transporter receptor subunit TctC